MIEDENSLDFTRFPTNNNGHIIYEKPHLLTAEETRIASGPIYYIYGLADPRKPLHRASIRYIGKTYNAEKRKREHIKEAKRGLAKTAKNNWINSLLKEGVEPYMQYLDLIPQSHIDIAERRWIKKIRQDYTIYKNLNGSDGGTGGITLDEEGRKQRSELMKQKWQDPTYRQHMIEVHRGPAQISQLDALARGRITRGRAMSDEQLTALKILYLTTNMSYKQLAEYFNVTKSILRNMIHHYVLEDPKTPRRGRKWQTTF